MSELSPSPVTTYGGQAVIEGVMMRGRRGYAVAVRNPRGEIIVRTDPLNPRIYSGRIARTPFLRGLTLLWDALGLGIRALMFAADVALDEETTDGADEAAVEPPAGDGSVTRINERSAPNLSTLAQTGTVMLSLSFSILLFFALPAFIAGLLTDWLGATLRWQNTHFISNVIEGVIRLTLLVSYIWGIGRIPDIKRLFRYHGAEHKVIHAYEAGGPLTPTAAARYPLEHPRCGTGFLLTVVVISILLYTLIPLPTDLPLALRVLVRVGSRLLLLPVVAGIAYEFLRFSAANQHRRWVRWLTRPNLALQGLTTAEPDAGMLEVAITALQQVLSYDDEKQERPLAAPAPDRVPEAV